MRIRVKGVEYEFDDSRLTVVEARLIKKYTGISPTGLYKGLKKLDPDAIASMVFVAKLRAGEQPKWHDLDDLDIFSDITFLPDGDADTADSDDSGDDEDEEPDPT